MSPDRYAARLGRALLHLFIVGLGLVTIVGSGGGAGALGFPDTSCLNTPQGCTTPPPAQPYASLTPQRPIVQVGAPLVFTVSSDVTSPVYAWCWKPKGADSCVEIVGVSGPTYTLAAANLANDGAVIQVTVTGSNGKAAAGALVAVSSMPPVTLTDSEFTDRDWALITVANPSLSGLPFSAKRIDSGGNPGAYRSLMVDLPLELRSVILLNSAATEVYDPASQGAVYLIEFSLDCNNFALPSRVTNYTNSWLPLIEQGGRRYTPDPNAGASCFSPGWITRSWLAFDATLFKLVDGPDCGVGESCPDFSIQGLPMRLGLAYRVEIRAPLPAPSAASAPHFEQGLDNFRATVWRR